MPDLGNCVVYDLEVVTGPDETPGGWDNPYGMGFASGVTYDYATDLYEFFMHDAGAEALRVKLTNRIAISFNGVKFDSRVLLGNERDVNQGFTLRTSSSKKNPRKYRKTVPAGRGNPNCKNVFT